MYHFEILLGLLTGILEIFLEAHGGAFPFWQLLGFVGRVVGTCAVFYGFFLCRMLGAGDIKLMAFTGILLGWQRNILAFFLACVLVVSHFMMNKNYFLRSKKFAFAPYLSMGILLSWFLGNQILQLYNQWL